MIKLIIEGKPINTNNAYKTLRNSGIMYTTKEAKDYKMSCLLQAKNQYKGKVLEGELEVTMNYYFKDKRRRDHLNYTKFILDALSGIIWKDDCQIKTSHHYTNIDKENQRIELEIVKKVE